jgi:hypothetical protein
VKAWPFACVAIVAGCRANVTSVGEFHPGVQSVESGVPRGVPASTDAGSKEDARSTGPGPQADAARGGFYLEAEDGALTAGFVKGNDPAASAGMYVSTAAGTPSSDVPGAARAVYRFGIVEPGAYVVWGRIHSPDVARNALWVRVDSGRWYLWRLSTGEDWYWGSFHDNVAYNDALKFELLAGDHEVEVANFVDGVGLDRLYVTMGSERPLGDDTPCHPPDSIRLGGTCVSSCGSQGGTTCGADVCGGRTPIPAYDCAVCCIGP